MKQVILPGMPFMCVPQDALNLGDVVYDKEANIFGKVEDIWLRESQVLIHFSDGSEEYAENIPALVYLGAPKKKTAK